MLTELFFCTVIQVATPEGLQVGLIRRFIPSDDIFVRTHGHHMTRFQIIYDSLDLTRQYTTSLNKINFIVSPPIVRMNQLRYDKTRQNAVARRRIEAFIKMPPTFDWGEIGWVVPQSVTQTHIQRCGIERIVHAERDAVDYDYDDTDSVDFDSIVPAWANPDMIVPGNSLTGTDLIVAREEALNAVRLAAITPAAIPTPSPSTSIGDCLICMDKPRACVFAPCGHVCTCLECARSVISCPVCRASIHNTIQMYL